MDEIEFKQLYNHACDLVDGSKHDVEMAKSAMMTILQLVWDVHERVTEMQIEEDDDE